MSEAGAKKSKIEEAKLEAIAKMTAEIRAAAAQLSLGAVRYLVDGYYQTQEYRKATANQFRDLVKAGEVNPVPFWFYDQAEKLEKNLKALMEVWTDQYVLGRWCKSICGIGPIITAGLMSNIDIKKAPDVGHIHMFAGLNASPFMLRDGEVIQSWGKGQKRPWNASLKTLCWNIGESFVKQSNRESDFYGKFYKERADYDWEKNLRGNLSYQAKELLNIKDFKEKAIARMWYEGQFSPVVARAYRENGVDFIEKQVRKIPTVAEIQDMRNDDAKLFTKFKVAMTAARLDLTDLNPLTAGLPMLPPGHVHARAKRWTVKFFLSHYHHVAFEIENGKPPEKPFLMAHKGHVDYVPPPNWPMK